MTKRIYAAVIALAMTASSMYAITASADEAVSTDETPAEVTRSLDAELDGAGVDGSSQSTTVTTPDAPQTVSAVKTSDGLKLTWKKVPGATGYYFYCVSPKGEDYGYFYENVWGQDAVSYTYTDYNDSKSDWTYTIKTFVADGNGNKAQSAASVFGTIVNETTTMPAQGKITKIDKETNALTVHWENLNCDKVEVECSSDGSTWKPLGTVKGTDTDVRVKSLQNNKTYYFRLRGYNLNIDGTAVYGLYSPVAQQTTGESKGTVTAPGGTTIYRVNKTYDAVRLFWNEVDCDGYEIYINRTGDAADWKNLITLTGSKTLQYRVTGLEPEHDYWFSIRAYRLDSDGKLVPGEWYKVQATTTRKKDTTSANNETVTPEKVVITKTSKTYDAVRVNWSPVKADGFFISYSSDNGLHWQRAGSASSGSTTYRIAGLNPGTSYLVTVSAYNRKADGKENMGTWADNVLITTKSRVTDTTPKPAATSIYKTSKSKTAIRLNWQWVQCDGYLVYKLENTTWKLAKGIRGSGTTTWREGGLNSGKTCFYKVRTFNFNKSGKKVLGDYSQVVSVTTKK